ncbi:hypothetical protein MPTK1_2g21010 [Marchantia polymorpha subsp. ruderalis]|uniref:Uncharacterized protein n=1 Tax=Marchantia polymorpha TaxID=3197 RepID=A0A2R6X2X8_MARPO|nr:hypothetical protein MARPO_0040s0111 [Marchantia polymorpha]BBN03133.1 hypothetical protein Mp_2g21010 [Marchantia polymorpha subsp. ruderalis]|eukprot:PTQ40441.1 hypothetical protein MARPO_0040s0111 [Marchantia polymorpha]
MWTRRRPKSYVFRLGESQSSTFKALSKGDINWTSGNVWEHMISSYWEIWQKI